MNRGARRTGLFAEPADYDAFLCVLCEAGQRIPVRVLAFAVMPNHWHLVLWPREDGHLSAFMAWTTATHVRRWHVAHGTTGSGTLYQGRFKAVPVSTDEHFLTLCRYVERNPVRAGLVARADEWPWSSASEHGRRVGPPLHAWPVPRPGCWAELLHTPEPESDLRKLRRGASVNGPPLGPRDWSGDVAARLQWYGGFRGRGRPPKIPAGGRK